MVPEYAEIIEAISKKVEPIEFNIVTNDEYLLVYERRGHFLVLEGDPRVRGIFSLSVATSLPLTYNSIYSLRLLMQVLGDHSKPSLENQLQFLMRHMETLFDNLGTYERVYRAINGG